MTRKPPPVAHQTARQRPHQQAPRLVGDLQVGEAAPGRAVARAHDQVQEAARRDAAARPRSLSIPARRRRRRTAPGAAVCLRRRGPGCAAVPERLLAVGVLRMHMLDGLMGCAGRRL